MNAIEQRQCSSEYASNSSYAAAPSKGGGRRERPVWSKDCRSAARVDASINVHISEACRYCAGHQNQGCLAVRAVRSAQPYQRAPPSVFSADVDATRTGPGKAPCRAAKNCDSLSGALATQTT